jgi:putative oxidoreductase
MKSLKKILLGQRPLSVDIASLLLRLTLGGLLVTHGYSKILSYESLSDRFPDLIGIGPVLSLNLLIFAEFFCSIFLIVGFFTRLSAIPIAIAMAVACFIAHAGDPFSDKEHSLSFLCLAVIIFIIGSGKFSLDRLMFKKI